MLWFAHTCPAFLSLRAEGFTWARQSSFLYVAPRLLRHFIPRKDNFLYRHSREGGNPAAFDFFCRFRNSKWIPAFAGMTSVKRLLYAKKSSVCKPMPQGTLSLALSPRGREDFCHCERSAAICLFDAWLDCFVILFLAKTISSTVIPA